MITMGLIVPMYNAMLCIYYLLVVKYKVRDEVIAKYEPLMHFVSFCPGLIVAIVAAANDLFNNFSFVCWIQERYNFDPNDTNGHEPSIVLSAIYITYAIFGTFVLFTIVYCMISLYKFVKNQEIKMSTYQFQRPDSNSGLSSRNSRRSSQSSRLSNDVVDTKKQAFLYVASFILTYLFTVNFIIFEIFETELPYILMLIQGILAPLQGLWNFLAYIRPRFNIVCSQHNE